VSDAADTEKLATGTSMNLDMHEPDGSLAPYANHPTIRRAGMSETMKAYVCYKNSDLTEGRGFNYPYAVCRKEATAQRLCLKADVQGTNATYRETELMRIDGAWFGPVSIEEPTKLDDISDDQIQKELKAKQRRDEAIENARGLGLSDEDISALSGEPR
jgi:hypothetical protein